MVISNIDFIINTFETSNFDFCSIENLYLDYTRSRKRQNVHIKNKEITIYGDGSQTRSFCYVDDTVDGLIKLMNQSNIGPINIGNTKEITVRELSDIVKKETSSSSNIIYKDLPLNDPMKRKPDISKAKKYLEWEPKVSLEDGLANTICYFKSKKQ